MLTRHALDQTIADTRLYAEVYAESVFTDGGL